MNVQSLIPRVKHLFQDDLPSKIPPTSGALETCIMSMHSLFPSVTDEWPFYNHPPSVTLQTWRNLCSWGPEQRICSVFPPVSPLSGLALPRPIFCVKHYQCKKLYSSRSQQQPCTVYSPSVTIVWPAISRSLLSITPLMSRTFMSLETATNDQLKTIFWV